MCAVRKGPPTETLRGPGEGIFGFGSSWSLLDMSVSYLFGLVNFVSIFCVSASYALTWKMK